MEAADHFCKKSRRVVNERFGQLWGNDDDAKVAFSRQVLKGEHAWMEAMYDGVNGSDKEASESKEEASRALQRPNWLSRGPPGLFCGPRSLWISPTMTISPSRRACGFRKSGAMRQRSSRGSCGSPMHAGGRQHPKSCGATNGLRFAALWLGVTRTS